MTLKDPKADFPNKVECRLLNPIKSDLSKIAKKIFDKINPCIKIKQLNQWKNPYEVVNWFETINNKANKKFVRFDIFNFYLSIKYESLRRL